MPFLPDGKPEGENLLLFYHSDDTPVQLHSQSCEKGVYFFDNEIPEGQLAAVWPASSLASSPTSLQKVEINISGNRQLYYARLSDVPVNNDTLAFEFRSQLTRLDLQISGLPEKTYPAELSVRVMKRGMVPAGLGGKISLNLKNGVYSNTEGTLTQAKLRIDREGSITLYALPFSLTSEDYLLGEVVSGAYKYTKQFHLEINAYAGEAFGMNLDFTDADVKEPDPEATGCEPWDSFLDGSNRYGLTDYSYAGYSHGERMPIEQADAAALASSLGYKLYNVKDYGAKGDGKTNDRAAFLACCEAMAADIGTKVYYNAGNTDIFGDVFKANAVIYFPEGEYILATEDDYSDNGNGEKIFKTFNFHCSNLIIKGAGRDKTKLVMKAPGYPGKMNYGGNGKQLWDGKPLISIGSLMKNITSAGTVTADAKAGSRIITVSEGSIAPESWIIIRHEGIKDRDYVMSEMGMDYNQYLRYYSRWTLIMQEGVKVEEYHQVESVNGNVITLKEPLLHDIDAKFGFEVLSLRPVEESGVEDLSFKGFTPDAYIHHGGYYGESYPGMYDKDNWWIYDSGYCMFTTSYAVNCWVRHVDFESVTEGVTFAHSSNCTALDMIFRGNAGHNTCRSLSSSHIFLGKVTDMTTEKRLSSGMCHAAGVNKLANCTVIYKCDWGQESSFESHCDQPRNTLIDCCTGGFFSSHRFGSGGEHAPYHLKGLTMWNFNCTKLGSYSTGSSPVTSPYSWFYGPNDTGAVISPIIVGWHGTDLQFSTSRAPQDAAAVDYSHGSVVQPESLYENQLRLRLGHLPSWLR